MAIFKNRFPSRREILLVLAACVVPIYSWSVFTYLERVTGWLFYLELTNVLGIFAYTLVFALVESVVVLLPLVLLAALLPQRLLRAKFVALASMMVLLTSGWVIAIQYNDHLVRQWSAPQFLVGMMSYVASLAGLFLVVHRSRRVEQLLNSLAERLLGFLYIYVPLSILSLAIVVLRNV